MGCRTAVFTANLDSIALMPCNPAIGGIAKGHLVREIDALGGEMARCIDRTGIQFRVLNRSKGPAVRGYRAQADKLRYRLEMKAVLERQVRLDIKQALIERLLVEDGRVCGVVTQMGETYQAPAVVVSTGTFLRVCHIGLEQFPADVRESFSRGLSKGMRVSASAGRLKTGTCPPDAHCRFLSWKSSQAMNHSAVFFLTGGDPPVACRVISPMPMFRRTLSLPRNPTAHPTAALSGIARLPLY
jgi:tRNA uridine 5-carboxymethylaminomethyl modification enzyme